MRVLVTGATGFVGHAVAAALVEAGHEVVALTRSDRPVPPGVQRISGDLLDEDAVASVIAPADVEGVCHLAALVRVRDSRTDPLAYWRTNVGGTLGLLRAFRGQPAPPRLVIASTCAVYADRAPQPITEAAAVEPGSPYGTSKWAADRAVADVAATGELGAISLRAFNVAGGLPGHPDRDETRLIPKVVAVAQGRAAELVVNGDGSAVRDFVHVGDMADAFVRALDACRPGHWTAYNVGGGRRVTVSDVVAAAEAVAGRRIPVRHGPAAQEPAELIADTTLIRRELGWHPRRSDIERIVTDALHAARVAYSASE